jgi:acylglycerol lipase
MHTPAGAPQFHSWKLSDGYEVQGRVWAPAQTVRTVVLYLHGIQSHGGWYAGSAANLAGHGLGVILPDRRGSGLNERDRGDVRSYRRWLADLDEIADWATHQWQAKHIGVVGVSWGGKLALAWAAHRRGQTPVLLLAPGLFPQVDVSFWTKLRIALALIVRPKAPFEIPLNDPALFTDQAPAQEFIANDRQKLTTATARFLVQSAKLDHYWWRQARREWISPLTVCLAQRDRIVNNRRTLDWMHRIWDREVIVHQLPSAHSLEFEPALNLLAEPMREFAQQISG